VNERVSILSVQRAYADVAGSSKVLERQVLHIRKLQEPELHNRKMALLEPESSNRKRKWLPLEQSP